LDVRLAASTRNRNPLPLVPVACLLLQVEVRRRIMPELPKPIHTDLTRATSVKTDANPGHDSWSRFRKSLFLNDRAMVSSTSRKTREPVPPTRDFECLDCRLVAPLNMHGRCERCDSNGVVRIHPTSIAKRAA
jgi:hypothetical protein